MNRYRSLNLVIHLMVTLNRMCFFVVVIANEFRYVEYFEIWCQHTFFAIEVKCFFLFPYIDEFIAFMNIIAFRIIFEYLNRWHLIVWFINLSYIKKKSSAIPAITNQFCFFFFHVSFVAQINFISWFKISEIFTSWRLMNKCSQNTFGSVYFVNFSHRMPLAIYWRLLLVKRVFCCTCYHQLYRKRIFVHDF